MMSRPFQNLRRHKLPVNPLYYGSNVFNILLILGCSSVITPLSFSGMSPVDAGMLILSSALLLLWAFTGRKCRIDRWEGAIMLLTFAAYYYYLFTKL